MTEPLRERIREAALRVLAGIAPEADLAALDPAAPLRETLDLDSMDFLNFVVGLLEETGIDVPESEYGRLASLDACVDHLAAETERAGRA